MHISQLSSYFVATHDARIGILTDGVSYRFYADLERPNIMDETPFFEFNMLDIQPPLVNVLTRFTKLAFDLDQILTAAKDLKYTKEIKHLIGQQLNSPTEEFVRFVISALGYKGTKTKAMVQQFTEIVKRALNEFMKEQHPQPIPTPEPSADPDNSSEQPTDDENLEPEDGKTLILEDQEKRKTYKPKCKNYRACLDKCLEILLEIRGDRFEEVLDFRLERQQRSYFSRNPDDLIHPREVGETGIYIYGTFSADRVKKIVEKVAAHFGCKATIEE